MGINFREFKTTIFRENKLSRIIENRIFRGIKLSRICQNSRKSRKFLPCWRNKKQHILENCQLKHFEIQRSGDLISSPRHGDIIYFSRAQFNIPRGLSG